uniref:Uncharacterized protein n=1 Tax=Geobacillus sp. (strain Y4.1MC1) TaxID=581103 RepID=A0A7U3YEW9_GEOS0
MQMKKRADSPLFQSVEKVGRQEKVHEECELFLFFFSSIW